MNKKYTVRVTDQSGHTTTSFEDLGLAVEAIIKEHFDNGRWPYVGATPFQFSAASVNDQQALLGDITRLRALLSEQGDGDEVIITITGSLQGGVEVDVDKLKSALLESLNAANEAVVSKVVEAIEGDGGGDEPDEVFEVSREDLENLPAFVEQAQEILGAVNSGSKVVVRVVE